MKRQGSNFMKSNIKSGAPGMTRTCGTQIRNLVLYPPELRGHISEINRLAIGRMLKVWICEFVTIRFDITGQAVQKIDRFLFVLLTQVSIP